MNNKTEMTYDPIGNRVKILETISGSVTSMKQFIGDEERDGSGNVTKLFFIHGVKDGSTNLFYGNDRLGSIRTVSDNSGVVQASYAFSPHGEPIKLEGSTDSDFGFADMYLHQRSGLNLTIFRAYSPRLGRWISRDPIEEVGGLNLYCYAGNNVVGAKDSCGLQTVIDPFVGTLTGRGTISGPWGPAPFIINPEFRNCIIDADFQKQDCLKNVLRIKPKCAKGRRELPKVHPEAPRTPEDCNKQYDEEVERCKRTYPRLIPGVEA